MPVLDSPLRAGDRTVWAGGAGAHPLSPQHSQVDGDGQFTRVSGSSVGGGTFWGLCSLLTGEGDFDKILALSALGNNANVRLGWGLGVLVARLVG